MALYLFDPKRIIAAAIVYPTEFYDNIIIWWLIYNSNSCRRRSIVLSPYTIQAIYEFPARLGNANGQSQNASGQGKVNCQLMMTSNKIFIIAFIERCDNYIIWFVRLYFRLISRSSGPSRAIQTGTFPLFHSKLSHALNIIDMIAVRVYICVSTGNNTALHLDWSNSPQFLFMPHLFEGVDPLELARVWHSDSVGPVKRGRPVSMPLQGPFMKYGARMPQYQSEVYPFDV